LVNGIQCELCGILQTTGVYANGMGDNSTDEGKCGKYV
jgi:hypothetical protein